MPTGRRNASALAYAGGLCAFYEVRGKLQTAHELEERLLHLAQQVKDPVLLAWAHYMLGDGLFWMGEFVPAQVNVEQSVVFYNTQGHFSPSLPWGVDFQVASYGIAGLTLWHLGYPDQAVNKCYEALAHAQKLANPLASLLLSNLSPCSINISEK